MACNVRWGPRSNMDPFWNRRKKPYNEFSADGEQWVNWLSQPWGSTTNKYPIAHNLVGVKMKRKLCVFFSAVLLLTAATASIHAEGDGLTLAVTMTNDAASNQVKVYD